MFSQKSSFERKSKNIEQKQQVLRAFQIIFVELENFHIKSVPCLHGHEFFLQMSRVSAYHRQMLLGVSNVRPHTLYWTKFWEGIQELSIWCQHYKLQERWERYWKVFRVKNNSFWSVKKFILVESDLLTKIFIILESIDSQ